MKLRLLFVALCTAVSAQNVEGYLYDSITGLPVDGAYVALSGNSVNERFLANSDKVGHFTFPFPRPASCKLMVTRPGYLQAVAVSGTLDKDSPNVRIELTPQSVIAGKLEDDDGFPVEGARVEALTYKVVDGERALRPAGMTATSNDLGEYRIAGLPAGLYYLRAIPSANHRWDRRYVPEYAHGSLEPVDGDAIRLAAGEERGGVNLQLTKHEGVTVSGRVVVPAGAEIAPAMRVIFMQSTDESGFYAGQALWDRETRRFAIRHVVPGTYVLRASSSGVRARTGALVAQQKVQVASTDVSDVVLTFGVVEAPGP